MAEALFTRLAGWCCSCAKDEDERRARHTTVTLNCFSNNNSTTTQVDGNLPEKEEEESSSTHDDDNIEAQRYATAGCEQIESESCTVTSSPLLRRQKSSWVQLGEEVGTEKWIVERHSGNVVASTTNLYPPPTPPPSTTPPLFVSCLSPVSTVSSRLSGL